DDPFLPKSTAYRSREKCLEYLHAIGLDVVCNKVIGEEYRVRFLIALLYYKYGVDCCGIDKKSIQLARTFLLATNQVIDLHFLEQTSIEYGYFECLLILSWKRKQYPLNFPKSSEFGKFKELFIYQDMKKYLRKTIETTLNYTSSIYTTGRNCYCILFNCRT
ncbi:MAG: helix-turn-helix domain-containing protein, partial [Lachnospiraceae bacterium]